MSVKRLLLLIVALGSDEADAYFGKTGLEHVPSCNKVRDDRNRLRVSLLLTDPPHPQEHTLCAVLTWPCVKWIVEPIWLNINPAKKKKFTFLLS